MRDRLFSPRLLFVIGLVLPIAGCTNPLAVSVSISPTSQSIGVGQTAQFTALGTYGHGSNHPSSQQDLTDAVTWTSSVPGVATISATGVATGVSAGTTTITASINGFTGVVSATASLTVTGGSGGGVPPGSAVASLAVIPSAQSVSSPTQTAQFLAIGTTTTGQTANLTNAVTWSSSSQQIATIGAATGLATAVGQGTVTITALYNQRRQHTDGNGNLYGAGRDGGRVHRGDDCAGQPVGLGFGPDGQFIALATSGTTGLEEDVTNSPQLQWISSIPTVATITSGLASGNGLASGVSQGTSTITAS